MTVIPNGTHGNIIYPTYQRQDVYDWMLANVRGQPPILPQDLIEAKPSPVQPIATGGGTNSHTVQRGDTLWNISQKFRVSVDAIMKANGLRSNVIQVGQRLIIPAQ